MLEHYQTGFWSFLNRETGAVSVDWVVLSAALAFMTVGLIAGLQLALGTTINDITVRVSEVTTGESDS